MRITITCFSLWSQVLANIVIPQVPKMLPKDRKVVAVGLTKLLTESKFMLQDANVQSWWVYSSAEQVQRRMMMITISGLQLLLR
jgi:hypothetical protein